MIGVDRAIQDDVLVGGIDAANVKNEIAVRVTDQSDGAATAKQVNVVALVMLASVWFGAKAPAAFDRATASLSAWRVTPDVTNTSAASGYGVWRAVKFTRALLSV